MIPIDFIYARPDTLSEAAELYTRLSEQGKRPVYYGGGSEIITMSRAGSIRPGAVIDLKAIPECRAFTLEEDALILGAANSLAAIGESKAFPLLKTAGGRVADHTNQCRITLGGNLCGTILYRETSLPLLISDAQALLYGPQGPRREAFSRVFDRKMSLLPGEFVVQLYIPRWALTAPFFHIKKTAQEKIDYPLVTVAALLKDGRLRTAYSGVCPFPFHSPGMDEVLNDRSLPVRTRAERAVGLLPAPAHSDVEGTGEYRLFVLKNTLEELLEVTEHGVL